MKVLLLALVACLIPLNVWAQNQLPPLSGSTQAFSGPYIGSDGLFSSHSGVRGTLDYTFPQLPLLSVGAMGEYSQATTADSSLNLYMAGAGPRLSLNAKLIPAFSVLGSAAAGGFTAGTSLASLRGLGEWYSLGAGVGLNFGDYVSLEALFSYSDYLQSPDFGDRLLNTLSWSVAFRYLPFGNAPFILDAKLPNGFVPIQREKKGLKLIGLKTDRIFPVFKNHYDENAVAQVVLHNFAASEAQNVTVSAIVKDYMNGARDLKVPTKISAGSDAIVDVFTLLNDKILSVAETTKLTLSFTVKYRQDGQDYTETYDPTIESLFRNAITWDDDQHVAAFISARDPAAFGFVRGLVASTRDVRNRALSGNLQTAMVVHEALKQHGLIYSKVPSSPFNTGDRVAVDTVQFPQETLQNKTGDCSDLTVLWCSLLESVGIETAAITTPGHIYMAFALEVTPEQAVAVLGSKDKFLIRGGKAWVPVETTLISGSFMNAWKEGARESDPAVQPSLAFYPIHEAWKSYAPVVVSGTATSPPLPASSLLAQALGNELGVLYRSELDPRAAKLQADIAAAAPSAVSKPTSSLALLYAKFGVYDKAEQILLDLTARQNYGPAFVNLGNIYLLQKKYQSALDKFGFWLNINPDDPLAVAGQALAYDSLGDRANSQASFDRLATLDKKLADRYSFLNAAETSTGGRAAEAQQLETVLSWRE